jgi:N-formylglutamate amidohydrolase
MSAPFELLEPTGPETPLIVEVPHAGLHLPAPFLEPLTAPLRAVGRDADLYVDALYEDAPAEGASMLVCRTSRLGIDVNRAETDVDADVVEGGRGDVTLHHGLVWRTTSDGDVALARRLTRAELDERLNLVWRPYHRALAALIERKRARFGLALVLAAHSMPSVERGRPARGERDVRGTCGGGTPRADVVPGTCGRRSAAGRFIDVVEGHAKARSWSVRHDDPYAGGYTTQHYGRPSEGVHVVQVELARRLYLDEATLRTGPGFAGVRSWARELAGRLGAEAAAAAAGSADSADSADQADQAGGAGRRGAALRASP